MFVCDSICSILFCMLVLGVRENRITENASKIFQASHLDHVCKGSSW